jgi:hypothetical protein
LRVYPLRRFESYAHRHIKGLQEIEALFLWDRVLGFDPEITQSGALCRICFVLVEGL